MLPKEKTSFNVYLKDLKDGWFGITNLKEKIGFGLKWDVSIFKLIMLWCAYGGYFEFPYYGRLRQVVAVEPWTAMPGSLDEVVKQKKGIKMAPQEELTTNYTAIAYETDNRIKGFTNDNKIII